MLLTQNVVIILCDTRFPENVGMAARACANFGCGHLRLVRPEKYSSFKAWPLATRIGRPILENIQIFPNISNAVADLNALYGTSARYGSRRTSISPSQFASIISSTHNSSKNGLFGILFGAEDRGLSNTELALCNELIRIPTEPGSSSLNIAQAVLLILYELSKNNGNVQSPSLKKEDPATIKINELELLENELKALLISLSAISEKNPDYFFSQWHNMLSRLRLKRHEFDAWMGLCRQIKNKLNK